MGVFRSYLEILVIAEATQHLLDLFFLILKENSFALGIKTPNWSHQDFVLWLSLSSFSHKDLVTKVQVRYPVPKTFLLDNVESGGLSAYPTLWASVEP